MGSLSTTAGSPRKENFSWTRPEEGIFSIVWTPRLGGPPNETNAASYMYDYSAEHYYGVDLPDFHKRKSKGELLPYTSYFKHSVTFEGSGSMGWQDVNYFYDRVGPGPWFAHYEEVWEALGTPTISATLNAMGIDPRYQVQRAAAKLYSRGWDGLTFVAELHKTMSMFKNALSTFGNLLESMHDLWATGKVLPSLNAPLSAWMELRYGWRILLYDIEDIKNLISSLRDARRDFYKERVGDSFTDSVSGTSYKNYSIFWTQVDTLREVNVGVRGSIVSDFVPDHIIANLPITAWELTKLSFVLDWFYNVGQALQALSFATFSPNYTAAYGVHVEITRSTSNPQYAILNPDVESMYFTQDTLLKFEGFQRIPCTVPIAPQLTVNLNAFKIVDILALVYQAFGRLSGKSG